MTCPHARPLSPHAAYCSLAEAHAGRQVVVGKPLCEQCQSQWTDGAPSTPTPVLLQILGDAPAVVIQPAEPPKWRGLGDAVAAGLEAIGIRKRAGCQCGARQRWLNRVVPFR